MICITEIICTRFTMPKPATPPGVIFDLLRLYDLRCDARFIGTVNLVGLWRDFIDPFFLALGWDMRDPAVPACVRGAFARHLPVKTRDGEIHSTCSFKLDGQPQFLVVLETPSAFIRKPDDACFRLRRFAWNAEIPLLIVTNFEEWAVYDCTRMPELRDGAPDTRIASFTYRDYPDKWGWISSIFSKEAVIGGSIRSYAGKAAEQPGYTGVAGLFLGDLEKWREILARNIANRNHSIMTDELNDAVHQTICRVILLQVCGDRGIHAAGKILSLLDLAILPPVIDDLIMEGIAGRLSGAASPYELSAIPPETLAALFSRFLEKTVRMRGGHQVMVEARPGERYPGISSPPRYIVEYMIRRTITDLTLHRTPREVASMHILDPSCGAGLFLSGMYQALLDWHLDWYTVHLIPDMGGSSSFFSCAKDLPPPGAYQAGEDGDTGITFPVRNPDHAEDPGMHHGWRLTFGEKIRILLTTIYGVDLHRQAVRMTILLLMIHLIRDENRITPEGSRMLEAVIITLREHIRCGNALIGPDYFDLGQTHPYNYREEKKVNPFAWHAAFPEVTDRGGFNAVIGNPPSATLDYTREVKKYLQTRYAVYQRSPDLTPYFIEKGISLLTPGGTLSVFVSSAWLRAGDGKPLRRYLMNRQIKEIIDFRGVGNEIKGSCILLVSNTRAALPFRAVKVKNLTFADLDEYLRSHGHPVDQTALHDGGWTLEDTRTPVILGKIRAAGKPLEEYVMGRLTRGTDTRYPPASVIDEQTKKRMVMEDPQKGLLLKPFLRAKDIHRYARPRPGRYLILKPGRWPASHADNSPDPGKQLSERYPVVPGHPEQSGLAEIPGPDYPQDPADVHTCSRSSVQPRIITPSLAEKPSFTLDTRGLAADEQITIVPQPDLYLLGILNSRVMDFFIRATTPENHGPYSPYTPRSLSRIPVYTPDFDNPTDRSRYYRIEMLVTRLLDLYEQIRILTPGHEQCQVMKEIDTIEEAIDDTVYSLYGLTKADRLFVNEETSRIRG
jgi:hypothetical protein